MAQPLSTTSMNRLLNEGKVIYFFHILSACLYVCVIIDDWSLVDL